MSGTILKEDGYRFYFYSREEQRMHVHVQHTDGEAKYWLEPVLMVAHNKGLSKRQLRRVRSIMEEHADEFRQAWKQYFES